MTEQEQYMKEMHLVKEALKPSIGQPIIQSIIASGPIFGPFFQYSFTQKVDRPILSIILVILGVLWITFTWYWYFKCNQEFKTVWEEILIKAEKEIDEFDKKAFLYPKKSYMDILAIIMGLSCAFFIILFIILQLTRIEILTPLVMGAILIFLASLFISIISMTISAAKDIYGYCKDKRVIRRGR